jgi:L-threonylcarbamoyladenylate synthase
MAQHVAEDLDGRIDAILDSGETTHGLESTVVDPCPDTSYDSCIVYRPGVITLEQIQALCPDAIAFKEAVPVDVEPQASPSPGVSLRHYAPKARLLLIDGSGPDQMRRFVFELQTAQRMGERPGIMLPDGFPPDDVMAGMLIYRWGEWGNEDELAHRLFAGLRWLDAAGATVILCPLPATAGIGVAIRDRLRKAARR